MCFCFVHFWGRINISKNMTSGVFKLSGAPAHSYWCCMKKAGILLTMMHCTHKERQGLIALTFWKKIIYIQKYLVFVSLEQCTLKHTDTCRGRLHWHAPPSGLQMKYPRVSAQMKRIQTPLAGNRTKGASVDSQNPKYPIDFTQRHWEKRTG